MQESRRAEKAVAKPGHTVSGAKCASPFPSFPKTTLRPTRPRKAACHQGCPQESLDFCRRTRGDAFASAPWHPLGPVPKQDRRSIEGSHVQAGPTLRKAAKGLAQRTVPGDSETTSRRSEPAAKEELKRPQYSSKGSEACPSLPSPPQPSYSNPPCQARALAQRQRQAPSLSPSITPRGDGKE